MTVERAIPILETVSHSSPSDGKDLLGKMKDFLVTTITNNWTSDKYSTSEDWTNDSGWAYHSGSSDIFHVHMDGWGDHLCYYRFECGAGNYSDEQYIYIGGIDPASEPYSAIATNPYLQGAYNYYRHISLPNATFTKCWFFANRYFCAAVAQTMLGRIESFAFGLPYLYSEFQLDEGTDKSNYSMVLNGNSGTSASYRYWNHAAGVYDSHHVSCARPHESIANNQYDYAWFNGYPRNAYYTDYGVTIYAGMPWNNYTPTSPATLHFTNAGAFGGLTKAVSYNSFSGKRIGISPTIFNRSDSDSQFYPIGNLPFMIIPFNGLSIGDEITYGSETYTAFPVHLSTDEVGFAFRTA